MSAHEFDEQLNAYIDGVLSDEERQAVQERLAADPEARKRLTELRAVVDALHALPRAKAPCDLAGAVMAQVQPAPKARRISTLGLFARGVALAAACILVAWGVSLLLRQEERPKGYELAKTEPALTQADEATSSDEAEDLRESEDAPLQPVPHPEPAPEPVVAMQRADVERDTVALGAEKKGDDKTPDAFDYREEAPATSKLKRHVAEVAAQAPSDELLASARKEEAAPEDAVKDAATRGRPTTSDDTWQRADSTPESEVTIQSEEAPAEEMIDALEKRAPAQAGRVTGEGAIRKRTRAADLAEIGRAQALSRARMATLLSAQGYGQLAAVLAGTYRAREAAFDEKEIAADLSAGVHAETLDPGRFTNIFFVEKPVDDPHALAVRLLSNQATVAANRKNLSPQGALHVYYQVPNGRFAPLPVATATDEDALKGAPASAPAVDNLIVIVPQEAEETE